MPDVTAELMSNLRQACLQQSAQIEQALESCFNVTCRIEVGDVQPWNEPALPDALSGPGIELRWSVAGQGVLALIPQTLPLPAWSAEPDIAQTGKLRALADAWLEAMQPPEGASCLAAGSTKDIKQALLACRPNESTQLIVLHTSSAPAEQPDAATADSSASQPPPAPASAIVLAGPVVLTAQPAESQAGPEPQPAVESATDGSARRRTPPSETAPAVRAPRRLHNLPVTVVVQLASKRIEVGQLMSMAPGSLISFNKSCEDLLDLYVNNRPYCRGEAVKIGEKFGIKINEVGYRPRVEQHVLNL